MRNKIIALILIVVLVCAYLGVVEHSRGLKITQNAPVVGYSPQ